VELDDETKRLSDVRPFQPMLKLIEKTKIATVARVEKVIQAQLSVLLGKRELPFVIICTRINYHINYGCKVKFFP